MNNFQTLMKMNGMTQKKLGEIIQIKGSTIPKYVTNPKLLRLEHIMRLSNHLGITTHELIKVINNEARFGIL